MTIEETAYLPAYYGNLRVRVIAPDYYYSKEIKHDEYSHNIVLSKLRDESDYFYPYMKNLFDESELGKFNLICVVPSSKVGHISPTMVEVARRLSSDCGVPFENIISRTVDASEKMTACGGYDRRHESVDGCMSLERQLKDEERNIILLDDTKTSGCTILECMKLLENSGATEAVCLCLGINSTVVR